MDDIKMEPKVDRAEEKMHRCLREGCSVFGLLLSAIGLLVLELIRVVTLKLLRPIMHSLRLLVHVVNAVLCDILGLVSGGLKRALIPLVELFAMCAEQVFLPCVRSCRLVEYVGPAIRLPSEVMEKFEDTIKYQYKEPKPITESPLQV